MGNLKIFKVTHFKGVKTIAEILKKVRNVINHGYMTCGNCEID